MVALHSTWQAVPAAVHVGGGASMDADVRAGPWAEGAGRLATVHAYVDHSVVSLIVDNRTALTAWVGLVSGK